jgi:hypothetical protein
MKQRAKPSSAQLAQVALRGIEGMRIHALARNACSTPAPDISDTSRSADAPPIRTATLPKFELFWLIPSALWSFKLLILSSKFDHFSRHRTDGTCPHAHHHIAIARVVQDGLRHGSDVVDKQRLHLAGDAQGPRQRSAVGRHDGLFAGGIDLGQQDTESACPITLTKSSKQSRVRV